MKTYKNLITGEIWTTEEIEKSYNDFRHESDYMSQFDSFHDYLEDQIRKGELEEAKWYAVQKDSSDPWDYGSYDYDEAVDMLKKQGKGLIAVISDDFCENEIRYEEII